MGLKKVMVLGVTGGVGVVIGFLAGAVLMGAQEQKQEKKPAQEEINKFVKDLDDDKWTVRVKATEKLIKIGKPALESVKKALAQAIEARNFEVRERAQQIVQAIEEQIRWAAFKGGAVACGLQATLRCEKDTYEIGKEIKFELEIKNVDSKEREFVPIRGFDDYDTPYGCLSKQFSRAKIVLKNTSGEISALHGTMYSCASGGVGPDKSAVKLERGENDIYEISFESKLCKRCLEEKRLQEPEMGEGGKLLPPKEIKATDVQDLCHHETNEICSTGDYEIQVVYYAKRKELLKDAPDDLKSNVVRFKVVKPEESDEKK